MGTSRLQTACSRKAGTMSRACGQLFMAMRYVHIVHRHIQGWFDACRLQWHWAKGTVSWLAGWMHACRQAACKPGRSRLVQLAYYTPAVSCPCVPHVKSWVQPVRAGFTRMCSRTAVLVVLSCTGDSQGGRCVRVAISCWPVQCSGLYLLSLIYVVILCCVVNCGIHGRHAVLHTAMQQLKALGGVTGQQPDLPCRVCCCLAQRVWGWCLVRTATC